MTWATMPRAEKDLQDVADSRYKEIASLAKLALAAIYHDTNRDPQAIAIYKQLADHPTASVGKSTAQFLLASLYEEESPARSGARAVSADGRRKAPPARWPNSPRRGCRRSNSVMPVGGWEQVSGIQELPQLKRGMAKKHMRGRHPPLREKRYFPAYSRDRLALTTY